MYPSIRFLVLFGCSRWFVRKKKVSFWRQRFLLEEDGPIFDKHQPRALIKLNILGQTKRLTTACQNLMGPMHRFFSQSRAPFLLVSVPRSRCVDHFR